MSSAFQESFDFLYNLRNRGSKYGLDRMLRVCEILGNSQNQFLSIHIAGTNGKGSTAAILESIYRSSGLKVGLFTSPHLVYLGERVQINRCPIPPSDLLERIKLIRQKLETELEVGSDQYPSFFEFITALAFDYFAEKKVDLAIVETGLGGRLDSTNVLNPVLSIITSIGLDHCEILGHDLPSIAKEKAGIIKENTPVVVGSIDVSALEVISDVAHKRKSFVYYFRDKWEDLAKIPKSSLKGVYQNYNIGTALLSVDCLQELFPVSPQQAERGLDSVEWMGRWQHVTLSDGRTLVLEATHNQEGAKMLKSQLNQWVNVDMKGMKPEVVFGCTNKERLADILPVLETFAHNIFLIVPDQPNACSYDEMEASIAGHFDGQVVRSEVDQLFPEHNKCSVPGDRPILCTGSIYLLGQVMEKLSPQAYGAEAIKLQDKR